MNEFDLGERIELLVEGELSATQRFELITELDGSPERWRVVALSFMEQQQLRKSLKATFAEPRERVQSSSLVSEKDDRAGHGKRFSVSRILTLASCFLVVFGIGITAGRTSAPVEQRIANLENENVANELGSETADEDVIVSPAKATADLGIVGYVRWDTTSGIRLSPVFDGQPNAMWLEKNPPQVNETMQRAFSRAGWRVRPARRLVSMQLETGDRFTIPMDDLTYQYVGKQIL